MPFFPSTHQRRRPFSFLLYNEYVRGEGGGGSIVGDVYRIMMQAPVVLREMAQNILNVSGPRLSYIRDKPVTEIYIYMEQMCIRRIWPYNYSRLFITILMTQDKMIYYQVTSLSVCSHRAPIIWKTNLPFVGNVEEYLDQNDHFVPYCGY